MKLTFGVFKALYEQVKAKYQQDLLELVKTRNRHPVGGHAFWKFSIDSPTGEPYLTSFLKEKTGLKDEDLPSATYLKKKYEYMSGITPDASEYIVSKIDSLTLTVYLTYLDYQEPDPEEKMSAFLEALAATKPDLSQEIVYQLKVAELPIPSTERPVVNLPVAATSPAQSAAPVPSSNARGRLTAKAPYLEGTRFWFFFYGYAKLERTSMRNSKWPLVKLLLQFKESDGQNIAVFLQNNGDPEHHDYQGRTDFEHSSDDVLVINCRTDKENIKQLHIKLHVGTAQGTIFLGQYLSYETDGHIISGNVVVQRIGSSGVPAPEPRVHLIPVLTGNQRRYRKTIDGIPWGILQYLHDKTINFRRNPLAAGHSLNGLETWLANPKKGN